MKLQWILLDFPADVGTEEWKKVTDIAIQLLTRAKFDCGGTILNSVLLLD